MKITFTSDGFETDDCKYVVSDLEYSTLLNGINILLNTPDVVIRNDEISLRLLIPMLVEKIIRNHC